MTGFSRTPPLVRGGIVLVDPDSGAIAQVIALQYNTDTLTRRLEVKKFGASGDFEQALRLKGPAVETFTLEAELDATDTVDGEDSGGLGLFPQLSTLESLVNPRHAQLVRRNELAGAGTLEIAPMEMPLALFVWSKNRIMPVTITELSVTEEAFDPLLNPIRARVSLGLRSLTVDDLGFGHRGGSLFMAYLQAKENLAARAKSAELTTLGITGLPA
jgi:hypothetical protein